MTVAVPQPESSKQSLAPKSTQGLVNYALRHENGEVFWSATTINEDNSRTRTSNVKREEVQVQVQDIRSAGKEFSLEKNGFVVRKISLPDGIDWQDEAKVLCFFLHIIPQDK